MPPELIPWFGLREPIAALSHFMAALAGVVGHVLLITEARRKGVRRGRMIELNVYGTSIVLLFLASGLFHAVTGAEVRVQWFGRLDHAAIFVLIAATTTTVIGTSPHRLGRIVVAMTWVAGALGLGLQLVFWPPTPTLSAASYVATALLSVAGFGCLYRLGGRRTLRPVLVGGVLYVIGTVFYMANTLVVVPGVVGAHEVFHLFVIGGASAHFLFLYAYVCRLHPSPSGPVTAQGDSNGGVSSL